jgi:WD40 repeat protein
MDPSFQLKKRDFPLPKSPCKALAAPDIKNSLFQSIIDWAPQSRPFAKNSKFAVALEDIIHIADPLKPKIEMLSIDFNKNRQGVSGCPHVVSLGFDRCGEALVAGSNDSMISIFDIRTGCKIRNLLG